VQLKYERNTLGRIVVWEFPNVSYIDPLEGTWFRCVCMCVWPSGRRQ